MTVFTLHDQQSAPEASKPLLEDSVKVFGMNPSLHGLVLDTPFQKFAW